MVNEMVAEYYNRFGKLMREWDKTPRKKRIKELEALEELAKVIASALNWAYEI